MEWWVWLIIFGVLLALLIVIVIFVFPNRGEKFNYTQLSIQEAPLSCFNDDECGPDMFCYLGKCWGYWDGQPMPFNNCLNPYFRPPPGYYVNIDGGIECKEGELNPYCKCKSVNGPGGYIQHKPFPVCGTVCIEKEDCPRACPNCINGICNAPFNPNF